ncbi:MULTISPECIES: NAD(P)/FAD-dependent oxidoreductase [unclassified Pseudonocardia]|jgi:thioredoxin reductase|uniref:NAD(P)/FAD-dependent oxidoreductase n=1 Tax=unclassified Pseudonocardia TaxID=2619320 RepID=UPI00095E7920|nr:MULTISPECIES: NAD(P)/FAD-dependent oxidoreductase [unclassified Pseudonocardia]MBN9096827.1 NAD(P)/FAD-dependent oxidoreductase [Pseudonocardia sp.]OJY49499.1 MAG: thioredoxin reductase [Pseudonocardia sp. 73-21]
MTNYDVLVVGGGAAGLSAALVLGRARRRVLVVDAGHPRNAPAAHMHGYLSRDGMAPGDFLAAGRTEVRGYGGEIADDTVVSIGAGFRARLASGRTVGARAVLVTTGLVDELPDVDGLADRWGRDVLHCPYCHGHEVRDRPLGVLASSPMAVHQALMVRQWSDDVTLFLHRAGELPDEDRERLAARNVQVVAGEVAGLVVDGDRLTGVRLASGAVVAREALFVGGGLRAADGALAALGARTESGPFGSWVAVDATGRTSVDGVWAAGNVVEPMAQVILAAAAGSRAAADINGALITAETDAAVQEARRWRTGRSAGTPVSS